MLTKPAFLYTLKNCDGDQTLSDLDLNSICVSVRLVKVDLVVVFVVLYFCVSVMK